MTTKREKLVTKKQAKRHFITVGLVLILYCLFVLISPIALEFYLNYSGSTFIEDEIIRFGVYFIILVFGTIIPFFLLRIMSKVKLKRIFKPIKASFIDLFVQTIVFFAVCTALTYVSNIILNTFGYESRLLSSIGFSYKNLDLTNYLYIFMLVIVSPLVEEYAFRGVLLNSLGKYGKHFALIASSIIFALAHSTIGEIIPAFAMGYLLGKTSLRYKSIQPTIVIHILFNAFLYGLCIVPSVIAQYMAYPIALVCIVAIYFVLTKRYKIISIQKLRSNRITNVLFYSSFTIILSMLLMIGHIAIVTFIQ